MMGGTTSRWESNIYNSAPGSPTYVFMWIKSYGDGRYMGGIDIISDSGWLLSAGVAY